MFNPHYRFKGHVDRFAWSETRLLHSHVESQRAKKAAKRTDTLSEDDE
jgi:hypothetical protein